ncbi:MAG: CinA family protein [Ruminococcus sp.]|jgi:nicotinamide-nucleotide amidase|nr:CinA family protein [Ruminococcus sp.]
MHKNELEKPYTVVEYDEKSVKTLDKTVTNVLQLAMSKRLKIATAESCTGGLISGAITSVSGASEVFDLGLCTYANSAKMRFLNVREETLAKFGAVSPNTAYEMASGLHELTGADICISVTGIAGPSGGSDEKPVGTVFAGIYFCGEVYVYLLKSKATDTRDKIRNNTVEMVFDILEKTV